LDVLFLLGYLFWFVVGRALAQMTREASDDKKNINCKKPSTKKTNTNNFAWGKPGGGYIL
jgi:hypothetical protein